MVEDVRRKLLDLEFKLNLVVEDLTTAIALARDCGSAVELLGKALARVREVKDGLAEVRSRIQQAV